MKKTITVLGLHCYHDAGAALIQNGKILAAINEERLNNIKHYSGYPKNSIEEVFKISKIDPATVDAICITNMTTPLWRPEDQQMFPNFTYLFNSWSWTTSNPEGLKHITQYNSRLRILDELRDIFRNISLPIKKIIFVEHHTAHAAAAYFLSPWDLDEDVLIFTADGVGDGISSTISIGRRGQIERLKESETDVHNSLGLSFYSALTHYLGMNFAHHPNKVMGLAPYGKADLAIEKICNIIDFENTNKLKFENKLKKTGLHIQAELQRILAGYRFDNIAAATQLHYEKLITSWINNSIKKTGIRKIACAGGNFHNIKANQKILMLEDVDDAFFCPAAGDEGLAVGCSLIGYYQLAMIDGIKLEKHPLTSAYFGSSYTEEQIEHSLRINGVYHKAERVDNIEEVIAELIAKKNFVVARFAGSTEWGPRALGNRSILADPSNLLNIRKINFAIKGRDFWMPFAPSILRKRIDDYLENGKDAPYMILGFNTTSMVKEIIAAVHPYDMSCRPQTVAADFNPNYEKLISCFESITGIGAILNTSFNLHGFPLVNHPDVAISTFNQSSLDAMAIGNFLIKKQ